MTDKINIAVSVISRLTLGVVFIYAALDKIYDPYTFAADIRNYQIIPDGLSNLPAIILPWAELICGVLLIIGLHIRSTSILIISMVAVFIIAISLAMFRGLTIDCGCYHTLGDSTKIGYKKLAEDSVYLIMAIYLLISRKTGPALDKYILKSDPVQPDK